MGAADMLVLALTHPLEFRTLINFWIWHEPKRDITSQKEYATSGWDRPSMRKCWEFLDLTSRSFSAVIKELEGDLARTVCVFYLVLRGLDTIEDDMTLSDEVKQPLLRNFDVHTITPGWNFDGSGPNESDRQLLVEYENVVTELLLLDAGYREVILDICRKMAAGMATYAHKAALVAEGKATSPEDLFVADGAAFDLYCHHVAGVVGEGLSRLLAISGKEAAHLGGELELSNAMGLMLQKTNIMRDYREDVDQQRYFWPRTFWTAHGFSHQGDLRTDGPNDGEARTRAMWVLSEMILDALRHAEDCLDYLSLLRNQSVFNFCAIPQTMAMATLSVCFMNGAVFERNVKIRKAAAVELIMRSTNPRDVAYMFRDYARVIHAKVVPQDPSYIKICVACAKVEMWAEHHFPSFIHISSEGGQIRTNFDASDARAKVLQAERLRGEKRIRDTRALAGDARNPGNGVEESGGPPILFLLAIMGMALLIFGGTAAALYYLASNGWLGEA